MGLLRTGAAIALAALSAACAGRERPAAHRAGRDSASGVLVDPATVPGSVALELWQLREGITLADWMSARIEEHLERPDTATGYDFAGEWCARAEKRTRVAGHTLVRSAFFFPPPSTGLQLPPDSQPEQLMAACTLGLVWAQVAELDSTDGATLADSVRAALTRAYGGAGRDTGMSFWGSAFWTRRGRFRRGDVTVVSALNGMPRRSPADTGRAARDVIAFAFLAGSLISVDSGTAFDARGGWAPDTLPLEQAVAASGLDTAASAPLRRVLADAAAWHPRDTSGGGMMDPAPLAGALRRWLAAAALLPPRRRAAALFVADEVLERAACAYLTCGRAGAGDSARLRAVRALGARFSFSPLGAAWVYTRNWLADARVLDRDSPVGQAALLLQLDQGFDFSGTCAAGPEGFRRVIDNGERYLARLPASPIAADVHFLVGEGYRDIVALAHGAGMEYADTTAYLAEAPQARGRALEHYRAAIAAAPERPVARAAWRRAWWLLADLPVRSVRFLCVYD
jgi:hypothetical protein